VPEPLSSRIRMRISSSLPARQLTEAQHCLSPVTLRQLSYNLDDWSNDAPHEALPVLARHPRCPAAYTRHRSVEVLRGAHAPGCQANHALGAPTALRGGIAHPRFQQAFCFQPVYSRAKCAYGALSPSRRLDLFPNRRAISVVAKSRRRRDQ